MRFGCHVSIRNGYEGAARRAFEYGAQAFQYFPKNPRSLSIKDFDVDDASACKTFCRKHDMISVAHTPYSTSITPTAEKKELTIASILNDLQIANACGSVGVVVHFGSQISKTDPLASYQLMLEMLNAVLTKWGGESLILLENNAGTKGALGTTFEELIQIRNLCDFPEKIGFCLDTCHAFASGLWNAHKTEKFFYKGEELGYFQHLKIIHLNNSKYPSNSMKDRHANIFHNGYITEEQFDRFISSPLLKNTPFVLETPDDEGTTHKDEIEQLKRKWG